MKRISLSALMILAITLVSVAAEAKSKGYRDASTYMVASNSGHHTGAKSKKVAHKEKKKKSKTAMKEKKQKREVASVHKSKKKKKNKH